MNRYDMRLVEDNPEIKKRRSFIPNLSHKSQLDFNPGFLVPMDRPWEVLPGDTWKVKHALKIRMSNPPKVPVMDQLVYDMYFFYTPFRILWDNFDKFITGDTGTDWEKISDLTVPTIVIPSVFQSGDLLDFLGMYHGDWTESEGSLSALPIRGFYDIWNWYFRFEPLQEELYFSKGDSNVTYEHLQVVNLIGHPYNNSYTDYMAALRTNCIATPLLPPVNKLDDYFTRCLPKPQAGPDVSILGLNNAVLGFTDPDDYNNNPLKFYVNGRMSSESSVNPSDFSSNSFDYKTLPGGLKVMGIGSGLTGITGNTIRELRQAMAIDILLTNDARYGRRITENTYAHYGCVIPDYRVDFPEFLGTKRIYINVNQVIQSSSTTEASPQGNVGAWSETTDSGKDFVYSGVEHGYILTLGCVRILNRIYSQGLDPMFRKFSRLSYYTPELANISDMPVYTSEIYLASEDNSVFGYQEAWSEYRYLQNHIANHMRPTAANTLAIWNYAESYNEAPTLSEAWIIEDPSIIDRTMYLEHSATVSQFILDIYWDIELYRTIPTHTLVGGLTHSW